MKRVRTPRPFLVFGLLFAFRDPAFTQSYQFTKILDASTQRPDGLGRFFVGVRPTAPAFDGRWVVFRDPGPQNDDGSHAAIWSFDTRDQSFHKLLDANTPVPDRPGILFHDISLVSAAPIVRNGVVVFLARDTKAREGLYSIPAGGGRISRIADADTPDPSGGTFTVFDSSDKPMGAFSFDGATVAFNASSSAMLAGTYSVKPDGSALGVVADGPAMGNKILAFYSPAVSGTNVVMLGTSGLPVPIGSFYAGVYVGSVGGKGAVTELANSGQQLPGNTNPNPLVRFDWPLLAFDGSMAAFHATDSKSGTASNPAGFFGLYSVDIGSHALRTIAHVNSTLPRMGSLVAIASGGVAVSQGAVLFRATDSAGLSALCAWRDGSARTVIARGDALDGVPVQGLGEPGPGAMYGSSFVFLADFGALNQALYLATPVPGDAVLAAAANSASNVVEAIAPGEIVTLAGAAMGPAELTVSQFDANGRLPSQLGGVQVFFNGVPAPLIYVSEQYHAAIVPFGLDTSREAQVAVTYNNRATNTIVVPTATAAPGIFSADMSGSGPGAIQNSDGSLNSAQNPALRGSVVVLYLTGLGGLSPAPTDGARVSASALPVLEHAVSVTIGGHPAVTAYQGAAPEQVAGMYQVNCVVPAEIPPGAATVTVTVDGRSSQANLTVAVE